MKALIVGAGGQLGRALIDAAPAGAEVVALGRGALDVTDRDAVRAAVAAAAPDIVFNAAAYTAVDRAESDEAAALAVNAGAVAHLADAAAAAGARLVHVSTDFVFDGTRSTPYPPDAPCQPLGAYGRTKLAGEVAAGEGALVVRTGWLYAAQGHNFVRTMLRLMRGVGLVRVVADQIGTPTHAAGLATALWALAGGRATGIHHWSDSGVASWYDFAVAIAEDGYAAGLLDRTPEVVPIATADFPTPARRPSYAVLDKAATVALLGQAALHWRAKLRSVLGEIARDG